MGGYAVTSVGEESGAEKSKVIRAAGNACRCGRMGGRAESDCRRAARVG